jgi:hypothetical protein
MLARLVLYHLSYASSPVVFLKAQSQPQFFQVTFMIAAAPLRVQLLTSAWLTLGWIVLFYPLLL